MKTLTVFYDSLCPVCNAEIKFIRRRDKKQVINYVDITQPGFDPALYGKSINDFIGSMHGLDENGHLIEGVEVFRQMYSRVGLGWLLAISKWPVFRQLFNWAYRLFARVRPRFSKFSAECSADRCAPESLKSAI